MRLEVQMKNTACRSLAIAALTIPHAAAYAQTKITIATGSSSGLYYAAGDAICRAVSADYQKTKTGCAVVATRGSAANVLELNATRLPFAIVQSDVQFHAVQGRDVFAFVGAAQDIRSAFSIHIEALTILVRADSTFSNIEELRGKRLNLGPLGTGTRETGEDLLKSLGWSAADRSNIASFEPDQNADALCSGKVDAVGYLVGHPAENIHGVTAACPARMISLDRAAIEKLAQTAPAYAMVAIPGGLYAGNPNPTVTLGVAATVVTLASVPEQTVYALVKSSFEHLDALRSASPAFSSLDSAQMIRIGMTAPFHPGAIKYFREKGWMNTKEDLGAEAAGAKSAGPPSLKLKNVENTNPIVANPEKGLAPPADNLEPKVRPPSVDPVQPPRNRWEPDTSRF
jgi:hypothetical protein